MKVANVKLGWKRSVSTDLDKIVLTIVIDGNVTTTELPPESEEFMIKVRANQSFSFSVNTYDKEGFQRNSEVYAETLGDLEAPEPATGLFHEVVSIVDEDDAPAAPSE